MPDEYWLGQVVLVTAKLTDPANAEAPTDDAGETLVAFRPDLTHGPVTSTAHPSTGTYTAQVTTDQQGFWQINDGRGGVYEFYVRPVRS